MAETPSVDPRFRALFDAHHRTVQAYLLRRLPVADANEAVADVFLAAWRHIDEPRVDTTGSRLLRFAKNVVVDWRHLRTQVRLVVRDGASVPVVTGARDVQIVRHPDQEAVHEALSLLGDLDREIVQLVVWEGLAINEIGGIVGVSPRQVGRRYRSALGRLAAQSDIDPTSFVIRLESANPIPSFDSFPTGAVSAATLLSVVDERHDLAGKGAPLVMDRPAGGRRRMVVTLALAVAGAATVLAVVSGVTDLLYDLAPPNLIEVTTPPTTTVAVTPAPSTPGPVGADDISPVEIVETMYRRWSDGDIAGYRELIDESKVNYNLISLDHSAWYRRVTGVTDIGSCDEVSVGGVQCTTTYYSGLAPRAPLMVEHAEYTIRGGKVVDIVTDADRGLFGYGFDRLALADYRDWVRQREPERIDELFVFGYSIQLHTQALRDAHAELVERYRTQTWPSSGATAPDPINVVDSFYGLVREGDVEGYTTLVSGEQSLVPTAGEARYMDVTGMAIGRICDSAAALQVTCDVTYYSGLAPGVEVTGRLLSYTVVDGAILNIEALSPIEDVLIADEPALVRYGTWLASVYPAVASELLAVDGTIVLDSEAARSAHRLLIEEYRAVRQG